MKLLKQSVMNKNVNNMTLMVQLDHKVVLVEAAASAVVNINKAVSVAVDLTTSLANSLVAVVNNVVIHLPLVKDVIYSII